MAPIRSSHGLHVTTGVATSATVWYREQAIAGGSTPQERMTVVLNSVEDFTLAALERVALAGEPAELGAEAMAHIMAAHGAFKAYVEAHPDTFIYGVTSDYGPHARDRLDTETRLRRRRLGVPFLGLSFGDGTWSDAQVRAFMFAILALFVRGAAAVPPAKAQTLAAALQGPLPQIPDAGITSPGEMMPMFYLFRAVPELVSEELQASGGNTAASVGLAGVAAAHARRRMVLAHKIFALSVEALMAPLEHYDPVLKALWGDPYESAALDGLGHWLAGVPESGRRPYQAPVSYRILPRLLGQGGRAVTALGTAVETALAGMVSNPMYIPTALGGGRDRAISTGGYHNAPVAQALDSVSASWVDLASLAHRHIVKLHRGAVSRLPDRLVPEGEKYWTGLSTTYMEFVPNDMLDEMRRWAEPALLSPGEAGASLQDDVSAPGFIACRNEARVAVLFDRVMAILAAVASHALDVSGRSAPPRLVRFLEAVRERFPPIREKRVLGEDAAALAKALTEATGDGNDLLDAVDLAATPLGPGQRR
jgi:histidine ammonia-lyase